LRSCYLSGDLVSELLFAVPLIVVTSFLCFSSTKYRLFIPFYLTFQIVFRLCFAFQSLLVVALSFLLLLSVIVFSFLVPFCFTPASCPTPSSSSPNTDHFVGYGCPIEVNRYAARLFGVSGVDYRVGKGDCGRHHGLQKKLV